MVCRSDHGHKLSHLYSVRYSRGHRKIWTLSGRENSEKGIYKHQLVLICDNYSEFTIIQALTCTQPSLSHVLLHLVKLHFLIQPLGLPAFYIIMKWRGVTFSGPAPSW